MFAARARVAVALDRTREERLKFVYSLVGPRAGQRAGTPRLLFRLAGRSLHHRARRSTRERPAFVLLVLRLSIALSLLRVDRAR